MAESTITQEQDINLEGYAKGKENIEKRDSQKRLCKSKKIIMTAPEDGICLPCMRQIYHALSLHYCTNTIIESCPYCQKKFGTMYILINESEKRNSKKNKKGGK